MGWRTTFAGTLFVAGATSLPELVVTISALRLGAVDTAIGNLLGSNLFDVLILALDDIAYTKGPLLASVSPAHAITAFAAVVMSGIFIVTTLYRPKTRFCGLIGRAGIALLAAYLLSPYAVYLHGHQVPLLKAKSHTLAPDQEASNAFSIAFNPESLTEKAVSDFSRL